MHAVHSNQSRRMTRWWLVGCIGVAALLPVRGPKATESPAASHPVFAPCQIGMPDTAFHMQAECTSIRVPENRADPSGRKIRLHIAVLSARSSHPAADALFVIAGGPGQAATQAYVTEASAFERIRRSHDIVLVDQRGTGDSNRLDCPTDNSDRLASDADIVQQAKTCLAQLPGDPRFYTTTVAVKDLDAVRNALGYREIDLYGISYGTRVALEYLREFPSHVRSVILDGVVPPDWNVGDAVSLDAQQALNRIIARCGRQPACHRAFPKLATEFDALQRTLSSHPVSVRLRDPVTAMPIIRRLTWSRVANAIHLMSYSSDTASLLPLLIHQASTGDYQPFMAQWLIFNRSVTSNIAAGMHASVLCTEDVPFFKAHTARRALAKTYIGGQSAESLRKICSVWPRGVMEPDFKQPVQSDKPVLLLSGHDDPITPPANAKHVAASLPHSLSIVVPGQGHGNAMRGCIPRLLATFLKQASVKSLNTKCVSEIRAFPFFTTFNGPTP